MLVITWVIIIGLSFELLLKSICISRKIEINQTHKLNDIAILANVELSKIESEIFQVLTEYIIWDGKYPTPKKKEHLKKHWKKENSVAYDNEEINNGLILQTSNGNLDFDNLAKIWRRLSSIFCSETK